MALNLPRLNTALPIVDKEGRPSPAFLRWWQEVTEAGELNATLADPSYVTILPSSILTADRTLTAGGGLTLTDGGANGAVTIAVGAGTAITVNADTVALTDTAVTPATYGDASHVSQIIVDQQGRLTFADDVLITPAAIGGVPDGRQVISGAGLTGGGDLTADRTLAVGAGTGITVNADDVAVDTAVVTTLTGSQTLTNKTLTQPILTGYTVATLPAQGAGKLIYVTDESGGAVPAFSDGTDWRRVTDRAIVS